MSTSPSISLSQLGFLSNSNKEKGSLSVFSSLLQIRNKDIKSAPEEASQESYLRLQILGVLEKRGAIGHFLALFRTESWCMLAHDSPISYILTPLTFASP